MSIQTKKSERDSSVEVYRMVGCLIVVALHAWMCIFGTGIRNISGAYISSCLADGVAIFWLIAGFFLYRNFSYRRVLKRTLKTIIVPMFIVSFLSFFLINNYLLNDVFSVQIHRKEDFAILARGVLGWNNAINGLDHFWYLYVYILVMILSPVIYAFISYLEESKQREIHFCIISLLLLVWNDCSNNQFGMFGHHAFAALFPAAIEIVWGHLIYKYKEKIVKKSYIVLSLVAFLFVNGIRMLIQLSRYNTIDDSACNILYWYSSIGIISASMMAIFCFSLASNYLRKWDRALCKVASYSFGIYLIHPIVISFLEKFTILDQLAELTLRLFPHITGKLAYVMSATLIVTISSIIVCAVGTFGKNMLDNGCGFFIRRFRTKI